MTTGPVRLDPEEPRRPQPIGRSIDSTAKGVGGGPRWLFWILPVAVLVGAVVIFWALVETRDVSEKRVPTIPSPLVRVVVAEPEDLRLTVIARGTVAPRTESDLVAEVRGRVIETSAQLVEGGFFEAGDMLLRLDDREHRITLERARANVKLRESEARLATADATRRRELARRGAASAADLEQFESRELVAAAALQESKAARDQAQLDLERTVVRAPFGGRVRERSVDVGQFVSPGAKLGRIFAVDYSEVRLPIQTDELAFLDPSFEFSGMASGIEGAPVELTARLGGRELSWPARIDRAEAAIDEQTRMLNVVARVEDPYGLSARAERGGAPTNAQRDGEEQDDSELPSVRSPLPPGLFVTAEIGGRALTGVFVLPLMALRDGDQVFVFDSEGQLEIRDVSVVRRDRDQVIIDGGIESGDQVVISPLRIYTEGMDLRALDASSS